MNLLVFCCRWLVISFGGIVNNYKQLYIVGKILNRGKNKFHQGIWNFVYTISMMYNDFTI